MDEIREMLVQMHNLGDIDKSYIIYYDESNNIRRLKLTKNGLNIREPKCFVLGGIAHTNTFKKTDLDDLKSKLKLQKSVKDMKLGNLAKGNLPKILGTQKIQIFLQWLIEKNLFFHFFAMDVIYWSIVDIIDSILATNLELLPYQLNIKNDLYVILRADLKKPLEIFAKYSYPNVGKSKHHEFIKNLIDIVIERRHIIAPANFLALKNILEISYSLKSLPFLEDEEPNVLIRAFGDFYLHRISLFKNATHILDAESVVQNYMEKVAADSDEYSTQNYRFADSVDEYGIQISDVVIGLIGKCFTFINQSTLQEIISAKSNFSEIQRDNIAMLSGLIDISTSECPAFAQYTFCLDDIEKADLFFEK